MFKRRVPLSFPQKIRELIWPSMGWGRWIKYSQLRLIRIQDSTRAIATGVAFGASVSFTPLPGLHIITAAILSRMTGGSVLASVAGTLAGNPWTFPVMWWGSYKIGDLAFRLFGGQVIDMPRHLTWDIFIDELSRHPTELMIPWVSGGIILMGLSWPIFYILSYRMVKTMRHKRKHRHA